MDKQCKFNIQYVVIAIILCSVFYLEVINASTSRRTNVLKHLRHKEQVIKENRFLKKQFGKTCTIPKRNGDKLLHLIRHPRDTRLVNKNPRVNSNQHAVYFSGSEILRLKSFYSKIPSGSFTLSLTVKPEGGQYDPVTILELVDICNGKHTHNWLKLGIKSEIDDVKSELKYFATLKTERSKHASTLFSDIKYHPGDWINLDVTYDKHQFKFYRDGALVAVNKHQHGAVFQNVSKNCKTLLLGGDELAKKFYRGFLSNLRYWNVAKEHSDLIDYDSESNDLFIYDNFQNVKKWRSIFKIPPRIHNNVKTSTSHNIHVESPPCGQTVCDDPMLMRSYKDNENLRSLKEIRYKVFIMMNDDGTMPQITRKQLQKQQMALETAFVPYNITFKQSTQNIRNTFLRHAVILYSCDPASIGDNVCDDDCFHQQTGYDGGDCDHLLTTPMVKECDYRSIGDGTCDSACNKFVWDWDGGDCCHSGTTQCFDPLSPYRGYLSMDEFKRMIGEDGSRHLNIYLASTIDTKVAGLSTYPWDKNIYSINGGIVVPPGSFGSNSKLKGLIHEIGHVLGLWHVHHGISEMDCDDPCFETYASQELGDLCTDTEPTPGNTECKDPESMKQACGIQTFKNTPYRNFMSYADDGCIDHFTDEQVARMHCYLDLVYQPWRTSKLPAPIPLPPVVVHSNNQSLTLKWLPPVGSIHGDPDTICDICKPDGSASQFASGATASHKYNPVYIWQPQQATGPPDAEPCTASDRAWMMPDSFTCDTMDCYLNLQFNFQFIPDRLTLWVTYTGTVDDVISTGVNNPIKFIEIKTDNNKVIPLGTFPVSCDSILSVGLDVKRPVIEIRVYVSSPYVGIDAAEITSSSKVDECKPCKQQKYMVTRFPEFGKEPLKTSETEFEDTDVKLNTTYIYSITAVRGKHQSAPSPSVNYTHGQSFCGDGFVDGNEECDDGNVADGDGCNINCQHEEFFKCKGNPSNCYRHDGDGICEDYERPYSVADCGHYTPKGFEDQWVTSANANPDFQDDRCPETLLTGIPDSHQKCLSYTVQSNVWYPCNNKGKEDRYWIEMYFSRPKVATEIILHMGSDGLDEIHESHTMRIELFTENNDTKSLTPKHHSISCQHNPVHIPIVHDLTQPFFKTIGIRVRFSSPRISIAGARLRSSKFLDPVTLASCGSTEMYDINSGRCTSCARTKCNILDFRHGTPVCNGERDGDTCTITCDHGYRLIGVTNEVVCTNGVWKAIDHLKCVPISCGEPFIPYASVTCPDGFDHTNQCTFTCEAPSRLQGNITTIQCEASGIWSLPNSFCQIHCDSPSDIENAELISKSCKRGHHTLGKVCKFRCEKKLMVEVKQKFRKIFKLECGEDGSWKGEQCVPITCPVPEIVFKGLYTCTDEFNVGSKCRIHCPETLETQEINCKYDSQWDNSFHLCAESKNATCPKVMDTNDINFGCYGNKVGDDCKVSCFLPNYKAVLSTQYAGLTASQDETSPAVSKITCTGLKKWSPNPRKIMCKVECNEDDIGDGRCQGEYNSEECSWDGGDCCESTVGGVVFPFSCTQPCTCLDPKAKENKKSHKKRSNKKSSKKRLFSLSRYT